MLPPAAPAAPSSPPSLNPPPVHPCASNAALPPHPPSRVDDFALETPARPESAISALTAVLGPLTKADSAVDLVEEGGKQFAIQVFGESVLTSRKPVAIDVSLKATMGQVVRMVLSRHAKEGIDSREVEDYTLVMVKPHYQPLGPHCPLYALPPKARIDPDPFLPRPEWIPTPSSQGPRRSRPLPPKARLAAAAPRPCASGGERR